MSLGSSVALVAAGLAVAGGTSYVSLMHGGADARSGATPAVSRTHGATVNHLSDYLDASFSSLRTTALVRGAPVRVASLDVTSSIPSASFADRFGGINGNTRAVASGAPSAPPAALAKTRSIANAPAIRAAALRIDQRAPAAAPRTYQVAAYAPTRDDTLSAPPFDLRSDIRVPPLAREVTQLVPMENAPFPVSTASDDSGKRTGINFRSSVRWEKGAFSDPRVLLHIPKGFDPNKPSVMIVFFHGHGATLTRDVLERQQVPEQISEAGSNAVLVAPQLAYDARSSNPGKLWEPGAFARMLREASDQLTRLYGDRRVGRTFANMPVIIVAYSGGYLSAASCIERGGVKDRVRGIVLLDALYGEMDGFASWVTHNRSGFFVSAYTRSTQRRNNELERVLADRDIPVANVLKPGARLNGSVAFLKANEDIRHRDFVNHAWADKPIRDILYRLPEYRL
jgi:hypothetical protein